MRKILIVLLFSGRCLYGSAQQIISGGEPDKSVDNTRLARMDTVVNEFLQMGYVQGMVTLLVRNGRVIQYKGYGYADVEGKKRMHRDDLFRLASQTKAVVSVGLMMLFEEGKFFLDEPISDFLPAYRHPRVLDSFNAADSSFTTVPAKREITFRDLLTHSSGIDYPGIGTEKMRAIYARAHIPSGLGDADYDLRERMDALGQLPLGHQPGEKWTYGLNMDLIGCLIETISGMDLETYLTKRLFDPLGMKDTRFNIPTSKSDRLVAVYTEDSLQHVVRWTKERKGIDPDYPLHHKRYFSGGAGLTGTAWDYAIFLQMLLNGGKYNGKQILAPRTVQLMTTGQLSFLYNGVDNFGLSFGLTSERSGARDVQNEGSFYWGGYFGTTFWVDPKARLVCLIMTQQAPNSHAEQEKKLIQAIYQSFVR